MATQSEMSEAPPRRLLVVDDEPSVCELVRRVAEDAGFAVQTAVTHAQFRTAYSDFKPSAILLDLVMPEVDGVALLKILADSNCHARLMIMSGYHPELLKNGQRLGDDYALDVRGTLRKPFGVADLQKALRMLADENAGLHLLADR